jgi:hypothetical protein
VIPVPEPAIHKICVHCGAEGSLRLGRCHECGEPVCEKCGNSHFVSGERRVLHDFCLRTSGSPGFSMIKFIK